MTCRDCIHFVVCSADDKVHHNAEMHEAHIERTCCDFKDKTKFLAPVSCSECKHYNADRRECSHLLGMRILAIDNLKDRYCSRGKRKETKENGTEK